MKPKQAQRFDVVLPGIAVLSAFLNSFNIWNNTFANSYYTAAVTSMLQSWHNFFFASFDPAGFITVDKPPVTFWVQTLFAYIFGVHGWSVILPQALAGVGSVLLIYILVKPNFGKTAARFASLIMACSPIAVAVSRTNNIDSLLVFTLLLATWMLFRGINSQKLSWILGAFAMIGVGFNMKMLQAYMVVPAFYLFYLLAFKSEWKKKLAILAAATVVLVGVSLSWALIVDNIPAANRPYIGGSKTNFVLELALGYNGISRLTGMNNMGGMDTAPKDRQMPDQVQISDDQGKMPGGPGPEGLPPGDFKPPGIAPGANGERGQMPAPGGNAPQGRGMGTGMFGTGQAGPLRLFQSELSGQISWLLPLTAFACLALLAGVRRKKPLTAKQNETLFWLAWLLPGMAFFSVAGFFHQYYLIMLAPPIAALAGAGWVELCNQYRTREDWKKYLLVAALITTTIFELYILQPYQKQIGIAWLIGIGAAGMSLSMILILAAKKEKLASIASVLGLLVLLAAPGYWAATPLLYSDNNVMPQAGISGQGFGGRQGIGDGMKSGANTKLIAYLNQNNSGEKYFFVTTDANTAGPYIIATGKAVMAMGGFSGNDSALTVDRLKQMVNNKEVKYFLIPSGSSFRGGGGNAEVLNWIRANSSEVSREKWQEDSSKAGNMGMGEALTLYRINQQS